MDYSKVDPTALKLMKHMMPSIHELKELEQKSKEQISKSEQIINKAPQHIDQKIKKVPK